MQISALLSASLDRRHGTELRSEVIIPCVTSAGKSPCWAVLCRDRQKAKCVSEKSALQHNTTTKTASSCSLWEESGGLVLSSLHRTASVFKRLVASEVVLLEKVESTAWVVTHVRFHTFYTSRTSPRWWKPRHEERCLINLQIKEKQLELFLL